jgi:hypothetical protein
VKRVFSGLALGFVALGFAQQQLPSNPPPSSTPPTLPRSQTPPQRMPPDTKAPPPKGLSAGQIEQQQIQDKIKSEPALTNTNVGVKANDKSVTLTGTVDSKRQHDLALRIAQSYAGYRRIVDRIKIRRHA